MYIYEHAGWPNFTWDEKLILEELTKVKYLHGKLIGRMESIGLKENKESVLTTLTSDIIKSSEIESDFLDAEQVRSSVARRIGADITHSKKPSARVDSISKMMTDATQNYHLPLSSTRLFDWHKLLLNNSYEKLIIGDWRDDRTGPMQVISGVIGRNKVHFEAPSAKIIPAEMGKLITWFNEKPNIDHIIKAAIAHLWFVTLHPFDDGNGRIARSLADMLLARGEDSPNRYYSMSRGIMARRKEYYNMLESTQKGGLDITPWIDWFLDCLSDAIKDSDQLLSSVLTKAKFWQKYSGIELNNRQIDTLNMMLDSSMDNISSSLWAKFAKCSQDTAHRDILDLIGKKILIRMDGGRSTNYTIALGDN